MGQWKKKNNSNSKMQNAKVKTMVVVNLAQKFCTLHFAFIILN